MGRTTIWDSDRQPLADVREDLVARLLTELVGDIWLYEPHYHTFNLPKDGRGVVFTPDFWVPKTDRWQEFYVEVTDSANPWGSGASKRRRMKEFERQFRVKVVYVNRFALNRLELDDGAEALEYYISMVMDRVEFGHIVLPQETLVDIVPTPELAEAA